MAISTTSGTLKADAALLFPNVAYYVGEAEWNFWTDPDLLSKMPAEMGDSSRARSATLPLCKTW